MSQTYPFQRMPLPYAYDALEPCIDAKTMQLHHGRHLKAYVDHLNEALEGCPPLQKCTLRQLLLRARDVTVLCNAGGVFNHEFFFSGMTPGGRPPTGMLAERIQRCYGGAAAFQAQFKAKALELFGVGYTWLCRNQRGQLCIVNTHHQDTPLPMGLRPLACIDVWEHAYYLKHYDARADYIDDWFCVADFGRASQLYDCASVR